MVKIKLSVITSFVALCLCSCVFEPLEGPGLTVEINGEKKDVKKPIEVRVNQSVDIHAIYDVVDYLYYSRSLILYVENCPKDFEVLNGCKLYDAPDIPENWLCVMPLYYKGLQYIMDLKVSFDTPGEHIVKISGCLYGEFKDYYCNPSWFTYTFNVTE